MLLFGYVSAVARHMVRTGTDAGWPEPDPENAMEYLERGLRFLVLAFLGGLLTTPPLFAIVLGGQVAAFALADQGAGVLVLIGAATLVAYLAVMAAGLVALVPLWLQAALADRFEAVFDFGFHRRFLASLWRETLVAELALTLIATAMGLAGLLACGIGLVPAMALAFLAQAHLHVQLYRQYLARGGTPIPLPEAGA